MSMGVYVIYWYSLSSSSSQLWNLPERCCGGLMARLTNTLPDCSGVTSLPASCKSTNFWCSSCIDSLPCSRMVFCMLVSTIPGRIAMLVISGSSFANVAVKWLRAAFDLITSFSVNLIGNGMYKLFF